MLPTKFCVNSPFGSEEAKNRLSKWLPRRPSWISDQNDFSYFKSTIHPDASYHGHGGHLVFPIGMILAIFDLQVTAMLPTKFQVNWPFGSGEK